MRCILELKLYDKRCSFIYSGMILIGVRYRPMLSVVVGNGEAVALLVFSKKRILPSNLYRSTYML